MATAEQINNLVRTHYEGNEEHFKTLVLQLAASEAHHGHLQQAKYLKDFALSGKKSTYINLSEKENLFSVSTPATRLQELVVSPALEEKIQRILIEFKLRQKLARAGYANRRKILLEGTPGTGKTMTASVIASELHLPLYTVQMDKLITKFLGETSTRLRTIFNQIDNVLGVYFFDEFDAIGSSRSCDNEVGEMRRVLSSFLQFIEQNTSESIIIAATNNPKMLDHALFRRFDDVLHYENPNIEEVRRLLNLQLNSCEITEAMLHAANGLSPSDITHACNDAVKTALIKDRPVSPNDVLYALQERKRIEVSYA